MKIIFATNQDDKAEVSYRIIEKLLPLISYQHACLGDDAIRSYLNTALTTFPQIPLLKHPIPGYF